jgi:hypothetical protein
MRRAPFVRALVVLCAVILFDAMGVQRAWAGEACAWIVESTEDDGAHRFELNLSVDAPASVSVRFQGPGFTSGSMGGELIQFDAGQPKDVDGEGFDVSPGDDVSFDVKLYSHPLTLDELDDPNGKPLAAFTFHRKVGEAERTPPPDLAAKQCRPLG